MVDHQPMPEEVWLAKDQASLLAEVLNELPEHYGQALYLRFRQELSYEEIALILEVPVSPSTALEHFQTQLMAQIVAQPVD